MSKPHVKIRNIERGIANPPLWSILGWPSSYVNEYLWNSRWQMRSKRGKSSSAWAWLWMVAWSRSVHGFHQQDLQLGWAQATYRGLGWWPQKTAKELPFRPQVNEYFAYFRISKFPVFQVIHQGGLTACYEYHSSANRERCR